MTLPNPLSVVFPVQAPLVLSLNVPVSGGCHLIWIICDSFGCFFGEKGNNIQFLGLVCGLGKEVVEWIRRLTYYDCSSYAKGSRVGEVVLEEYRARENLGLRVWTGYLVDQDVMAANYSENG